MAIVKSARGKILALALVSALASLLIAGPASATTWITPKRTTPGMTTTKIQNCFLSAGGHYDTNTQHRSVVVDAGLTCGKIGTRLYFTTNQEYNTIVYWTTADYRTSPKIPTWAGAKSYVEIP
jgi:hypothetical protein